MNLKPRATVAYPAIFTRSNRFLNTQAHDIRDEKLSRCDTQRRLSRGIHGGYISSGFMTSRAISKRTRRADIIDPLDNFKQTRRRGADLRDSRHIIDKRPIVAVTGERIDTEEMVGPEFDRFFIYRFICL